MITTLFNSVQLFFRTNYRLVIEYIMIATVIALAGLTVALWSQKTKIRADLAEVRTTLVTTQGKVNTLEFGMSQQTQTIADLKVLRGQDTKALDGLLQDYKSLSKKDANVRNRLKELENKDETVRAYLNSPIPAVLMCLLNNTCDRNKVN